MDVWYRVFGRLEAVPPPNLLAVAGATPRIEADDAGWYRAEIDVGGAVLVIERWLADEEGIRGELSSWAALLETCDHSPHHIPLMERAIQARQLFTVNTTDQPRAVALCQALARHTQGFYQVDGVGFFEADGTLLVAER